MISNAGSVSEAGLRIIKLLAGNPPQTIQDLIRSTGVTRTAITEQIDELLAAGYVKQTTERLPSRGRPRHRYATTDMALAMLFPGNQDRLVPAIWRAIEKAGPQLSKKILKQVSRTMADHYSKQITAKAPAARLRRLVEILRDEGVLTSVGTEHGKQVVYKRSCPFISMVDEKQTVCEIDMEMMAMVVGKPVQLLKSRHDGAPCCSFVVGNGQATCDCPPNGKL